MNHVKKLRLILFILLLFVVLGWKYHLPAATSAANQVYYVSNNGSDSADGLSPDTAWQTLAHVSNQTFSPGDEILFKRGDTWRETLYVTSSGTSNAWIMFGAYGAGDDRPRFLGSEQAVDWSQVAPNIWQSGTNLDNPYQGGYSYAEVFFEELDGTYSWGTHQDYDASFSYMTAEYDWSWNANRLYIYAPSNPGVRYGAVEAPQRDSAIRLPGVNGSTVLPEDYVEYVAFDNLEIMYVMRHGIYPGYNEVEAHGLQVTNSHIGMIGVKGGSSAYCIAAWHSDMLIQNNTIHDCGRRGISLNTYTTYTPDLIISNVTIDSNHFSNGFHTTGPDISSLPGLGHTFTNFTISNNVFDDSGRWDAGIHDGCAASSCTSNVIYISSHDNQYSNFNIYNNVVIGSTSRAMLLVDMDDVHVYHNTVYGSHPDAQPYGLVIFDNVTNVDMRNNIFHGTLVDIGDHNYGRNVLDQGTSSFLTRDYNLYFQEDSGQPITGSENGVGGWDVFMDEWDSWQAASGLETNSPDPQRTLFVDRENGDFRLQADSPAVDAGVVISGINDGYQGTAPDLGAIEFTPALTLYGSPADQAIDLTWEVNTTVPTETTWLIEYQTATSGVLSQTDSQHTTRTYTLTGLNNYEWYTVTLKGMVDSNVLFSDTATVMPTDIFVYLPVVLKE
jgi:hypothetical protein